MKVAGKGTDTMRISSAYAVKVLLMVVLAGAATVAVACGSAEETAPAPAAPAPAPVAPAPAAQPVPATAKAEVDFTGGNRGGHMRINGAVWFDRWDMTTRSHFSSTFGLNRIYSGVLQFSPRDGLTVTPDLAESWVLADDIQSVTLKFREGVKWHDGAPFSVDDVIYTINRWIDPPSGVPQPRVAGFKLVAQMEKLDQLTLKITTTKATSRILPALADSWHIMLPKHILEPNGGKLTDPEHVIGTGAFKLVDWTVGNNVVTDRNPDYFVTAPDGKPFPLLDRITSIHFANREALAASFRTKQIDIAQNWLNPDVTSKIASDFPNDVTEIRWDSPGFQGLGMNASRPPFDDAELRQAFRCAIDTKQIVELSSVPGIDPPNYRQISFFGTADPNYSDILSYPCLDPSQKVAQQQKAMKVFEAKGLTELSFLTDDPEDPLGEILQQQLKPLGIDMKIEVSELTAAREQAYACDYEIFFFGQAVASKDPVEIINQVFRPGAAGFELCQAAPPQKWMDLLDELDKSILGSLEEKSITKEMDTIMREEWNPKVPVRRPDEFSIQWNYVHNVDAIPTNKFIQTRYIDAWLGEDAPEGP